jgi:hypothetical protein
VKRELLVFDKKKNTGGVITKVLMCLFLSYSCLALARLDACYCVLILANNVKGLLILSFCRVLYVICFLLGVLPASEY